VALAVMTAASAGALQAQTRALIVPGILEYVDDNSVAAQADGLITAVSVDEGSQVKSGSLIVQLDTRLAESEVAVASKELEAAQKKAQDKSQIDYKKSELEVALRQYETTRGLQSRGSASEQDLQLKWLEAEKARLGGVVAFVEHERDIAAESISKAKLKAAQVQVDLRKITAPFDGVVVEMLKHKNDWVRAGEPLLRVVGPSKLRVRSGIKPEDLSTPAYTLQNAPVRVSVFLTSREVEQPMQVPIDGTIAFISPLIDAGGKYHFFIDLENQQAQDGTWIFNEGMDAQIQIMPRR
jgi:multidrug efflux pump subunit AcrA (membrane-fusion protein)